MNKQIFTMAAIFIGLSFPSCKKISGEGPVVSEARNISGFHAIRSAMSGDVYIRQDSVYKVEIHAQRNIIDVLNTSLNDGELKIDYDFNKRIGNHDKVEIFISTPDIRSLALSGSGNITLMNTCRTQDMDISVSGSGTVSIPEIYTGHMHAKISGSGDIVVLSGTGKSITTEISGSGYIDCIGVPVTTGDIQISGSGDTKVNVTDMLDVRISGSGDVYYRGGAKVNSSISGSGKVHAL